MLLFSSHLPQLLLASPLMVWIKWLCLPSRLHVESRLQCDDIRNWSLWEVVRIRWGSGVAVREWYYCHFENDGRVYFSSMLSATWWCNQSHLSFFIRALYRTQVYTSDLQLLELREVQLSFWASLALVLIRAARTELYTWTESFTWGCSKILFFFFLVGSGIGCFVLIRLWCSFDLVRRVSEGSSERLSFRHSQLCSSCVAQSNFLLVIELNHPGQQNDLLALSANSQHEHFRRAKEQLQNSSEWWPCFLVEVSFPWH